MKIAFLLLALLLGVHTFHIKRKENSKNHQEITTFAILRATAKVCESVEGFVKPASLDTKLLAKACKKEAFTENFESGIKVISYYNVMTDLTHPFSEKHHFDSETFVDGKALIIDGKEKTINSIKEDKFDDARVTLGEILHTLQDFYSHSNWIELGKTEPCTALINSGESIPTHADKDTKTCEKSSDTKHGATFTKEIIEKQILTSGYFGTNKPNGKCSHGGFLDFTTGTGKSSDGINKDYSDSSHGSKHNDAAEVAIKASVQLLENIWKSIDNTGGDNFFRLMGLYNEAPKGGEKTIPFIKFSSRYKDATENQDVII